MSKAILACLMLPGLLLSRPRDEALPFRNAALDIERRVDDLLSRLTPGEKASQLLHNSPPVERLEIPAYNWWNECLHGVARAGRATVFPQAIGLAASGRRSKSRLRMAARSSPEGCFAGDLSAAARPRA